MATTTKRVTVFDRQVDPSLGPFSCEVPFFSRGGKLSVAYSEAPFKCHTTPTMVTVACGVPTVASLELTWTGFEPMVDSIDVVGGSLTFTATTTTATASDTKTVTTSVGIERGKFPPTRDGQVKATSLVLPGSRRTSRTERGVVSVKLELKVETGRKRATPPSPNPFSRTLGSLLL